MLSRILNKVERLGKMLKVMARSKVAGRNGPHKHIRARESKKDEKKAELARQRKYNNEARAKRRIPINTNVPSWARCFVNTIRAFRAAQERSNDCS
uniref:Uncharacterized protein n=1 Tax=Solanum tuberosum TaxID=4113 RepID=M1DD69_SOLTU